MKNDMTALCRLEDAMLFLGPEDAKRLSVLIEDIRARIIGKPEKSSHGDTYVKSGSVALPSEANYSDIEKAVAVITGETSSQYWVIGRVRQTARDVEAQGFTIEDLRLFYKQRTKSSTLLNLVADLNRWRADKHLTPVASRFITQADINSGKANQFVA